MNQTKIEETIELPYLSHLDGTAEENIVAMVNMTNDILWRKMLKRKTRGGRRIDKQAFYDFRHLLFEVAEAAGYGVEKEPGKYPLQLRLFGASPMCVDWDLLSKEVREEYEEFVKQAPSGKGLSRLEDHMLGWLELRKSGRRAEKSYANKALNVAVIAHPDLDPRKLGWPPNLEELWGRAVRAPDDIIADIEACADFLEGSKLRFKHRDMLITKLRQLTRGA